MPARADAPIGAPCWVDLMTSDIDRSRDFYCDLLGWSAEEPNPEFGGYFNFTRDGARMAGCMSTPPESGLPDCWSIYLATDDAQKTVEVAAANGGQVTHPVQAVGDLGTLAIVTDPGGATIGMWQPGLHKGFGFFGETGAPSWFELHTKRYEAAVTFYRDVFRWETEVVSDAADFRYTILKHGDEQLAGIMDASGMPGEGSVWSVYFGADDTDAALAKIAKLGGTTVQPAEDTPYGRLAEAADPTGAHFKLVAPNEAMPAR